MDVGQLVAVYSKPNTFGSEVHLERRYAGFAEEGYVVVRKISYAEC